jgi:hypothetical protein
MSENHVNPEQEQALARLKCAHCQSLINCEELTQAILTALQRRYCVERSDGGLTVTYPELVESVREGIDRFLRDRCDAPDDDESHPSAA